jgi:serine/threonine-protein kinase RsbW
MTALTQQTATLNALIDADTAEVMSWRRTYPGLPCHVREVRRFVAALFADHPAMDDVVSTAAELFNNAIQHTRSKLPGGHLILEVRRWPGCCATLAVTDQGGPDEPRTRELTSDRENGRGLAILSALTTSWGWHGDVRGRTVTAIFLG